VAREGRPRKEGRLHARGVLGPPHPGFGDPEAHVLLLGLAPAAHGANRTGRYFTGDRSGDFLFASLHRTGFSSSPTNRRPGDAHLHAMWISAAVRCAPPANKPTPAERDACLPYTTRELELLPGLRVVLALGALAWDAALRLHGARPKPPFAHGAEHRVGGEPGVARWLLASYHPSQQNTFTGVLKPRMLDDVLLRARELAGL